MQDRVQPLTGAAAGPFASDLRGEGILFSLPPNSSDGVVCGIPARGWWSGVPPGQTGGIHRLLEFWSDPEVTKSTQPFRSPAAITLQAVIRRELRCPSSVMLIWFQV
jgi:hypothetical protein